MNVPADSGSPTHPRTTATRRVIQRPVLLPAALTDTDVQTLGAGGVVIRDGAVPDGARRAIRSALAALDAAGAFRPAGMGRSRTLRPDLRGDRILWLDEHTRDPTLAELWSFFEALRHEANEAAWLGLQRFSVQVACFPGGGARYTRHRDALRNDPSRRRLTAIVYLHDDWAPEHGGALRVWLPEGPTEVAPLPGRLVMFRADEIEHEVLPAFAPRWAATAWYRDASAVPWFDEPDAGDHAA